MVDYNSSELNPKRNSRLDSGNDIHPIVVLSDSENDSDDDVAILSVCPPPPEDNDDCIVESYQPASKTFCADRLLAMSPVASPDDPSVDLSLANDDSLDLSFATYGQSADQSETFLDDVPDLGAWILSNESASSGKQPVVDSVQNACTGGSTALACSSTFGVPPSSLSLTDRAQNQPAFGSDSVQFNTVQLQKGGILFDVDGAKVSASVDKASVLSLSAQIQSTDRHSTTVSFVGSKNPMNPDFVSVQTSISSLPDDLSLPVIAMNPTASPDVAASSCQTASGSLNVNSGVDAALSDRVDGLLQQLSYQENTETTKADVCNSTHVKVEHQTKHVNAVDSKVDAHCCNSAVSSQSSHILDLRGYLSRKRKSRHYMSVCSTKALHLPVPPYSCCSTSNSVSTPSGQQPCPLLQTCCCCGNGMAANKLSHCVVGHPCCGTCLQKHFKSVLTGTAKVLTFCMAF